MAMEIGGAFHSGCGVIPVWASELGRRVGRDLHGSGAER